MWEKAKRIKKNLIAFLSAQGRLQYIKARDGKEKITTASRFLTVYLSTTLKQTKMDLYKSSVLLTFVGLFIIGVHCQDESSTTSTTTESTTSSNESSTSSSTSTSEAPAEGDAVAADGECKDWNSTEKV